MRQGDNWQMLNVRNIECETYHICLREQADSDNRVKDSRYLDHTLYLDYKNDGNRWKEVFAKVGKYGLEHDSYEYDVDMRDVVDIPNIEYYAAFGIVMGLYEFNKPEKICKYEINLYGNMNQELLNENYHLALSILFAKDMVNMPSNLLRPLDFAKAIGEFVSDMPIEYEVIQVEDLIKEGFGGLTSVGLGSAFPPCMVVLRYRPLPSGEIFGLVGKGVTTDTGGYNIKQSMGTGIRGDMAGAASVVSVLYSLAANQVQKNVTVVLPICENRISRGSLLPGDVITMYDKTTVEILNTDAEGRLILGDAISYIIEKEKVSHILDVATLTGQVFTMFGYLITGVIGTSDAMYQELDQASEMTKEHFVRIPYLEEHEKMIEGTFSDLKNVGPSYCGTITAAMFLKYFTKEVPWLHLDIAGTAWVDSPIYEYHSVGATGNVISTIYYMIKGGH